MAKTLLSIVIPTYNRKDKLKILLISLLQLKYDKSKAEIIIVDDGSNDNTAAMVKTFKNANIKYLKQNNSGPAAARNKGWKYAKGLIVGFLDSDVFVDKTYLINAINYFEQHKNIDCLEGRTLSKIIDIKPTYFTHSVENLKGGQYMTSNIFYSKKILVKTGGFDEAYHNPYIREDTDMAFAAMKAGGKFAYAENIIVFHPVYKSAYNVLFKNAKQGLHEPRLFYKYPKLYLTKMKWIDGWFFPVYYLGYYFFPVFVIAGLVMKDTYIFNTGMLFFTLSYAVTLYVQFRKSIFSINDFLIVAALFIFMPYLRLYWLILGFFKHFGVLFTNKK